MTYPVENNFGKGMWIDRFRPTDGSITKQSVSGIINGSNKIFTLPSVPSATNLQFFWNGILQHESDDYTLTGSTIMMTLAPKTDDVLIAYY